MKVQNMTSNKGNKIANQFIVTTDNEEYFQSYKSMIAKKVTNYFFNYTEKETKVYLDETYWNYSVTTSKYRNIFLNETTKETQKKIKQGVYILTNLNQSCYSCQTGFDPVFQELQAHNLATERL